jgi:hypothetical protein
VLDDPRERRPRPTPDGSARAFSAQREAGESDGRAWMSGHLPATAPLTTPPATAPTPDPTAPIPPTLPPSADTSLRGAPSDALLAAGGAIVTAARVGRLLGRSGWRIARQLPGARRVETEARRLQHAALGEARRLLQMPSPSASRAGTSNRAGSGPRLSTEERRAVDLIKHSVRDDGNDPAPLRTAMAELLGRATEATRSDSRDYLFGTIISQLTPDEARILAALAGGRPFAAADVVLRRRGSEDLLLANASTVGRNAGVVTPDNTPTYLTRLHTFGLVVFGPGEPALASEYDLLSVDATVEAARRSAAARRGHVRLVRKTIALSPFGAEFWVAADPARPSPR